MSIIRPQSSSKAPLDPPPRPQLLREYDEKNGDLYRTTSASYLSFHADDGCTANMDIDDDKEDEYFDDERLKELARLERKRWEKFVERTPLPSSWLGLHTGWFEYVLVTHHARFIDCCRLPGIQPCSCGAPLTCVCESERYGPVRWHRVRYLPKECCSCLNDLISTDDYDGDDPEGLPDFFCASCRDCYEICK